MDVSNSTDTESSRQNEGQNAMQVNCLSAGNTLLIKIDSVNVIRSQFDKFLEKFVDNEKVYHDLKIPLFVASSFSKLFKHWLEFPELQKLICRDVFEEIFREMARVFKPTNLAEPSSSSQKILDDHPGQQLNQQSDCPVNSETNSSSSSKSKSNISPLLESESRSDGCQIISPAPSYFKIFCNDCNENVENVNADPRLSYHQHTRSEAHVKNFNRLRNGTIVDLSNGSDHEKIGPSIASVTENSSDNCATFKLENSFSSSSCDSINAVGRYKLPTVIEPFCEPCCKIIASKELYAGTHLSSKSHLKQIQLYEESKKILKKQGSCFGILNKDTFEFLCHLCMKKQTGTNCFVQHCNTLAHQANLGHIDLLRKSTSSI